MCTIFRLTACCPALESRASGSAALRSNKFREQPLVLDILKEYDIEYLNDTRYTLTVVTSGFHDKISFVKLYKGDIKYDKYGNPSYDSVIFYEYIDLGTEDGQKKTNKHIVSGDLDLKNRKIIIKLYTNEEQVFDISEVQEIR